MCVYENIVPDRLPKAIALGNFDGVHLGHKKVLNSALKLKEMGLIPAVFTFKTTPSKILLNKMPQQLVRNNQKINLIKQCGIEIIYNVDFNDIKNLLPEEFIKSVLIDKLNVRNIICGFNFKFGKNASGDSQTMRRLCKKYGIGLEIAAPEKYNGVTVSSTEIRKRLQTGALLEANAMLGRPFSIELEVEAGNKIGRTIGIPTLNQRLPEDSVKPRFGVYKSDVIINNNKYDSITNIGIKPTVGSDHITVETLILGKNIGELYGKNIKVELLDFVRDERKFDSLQNLKLAIKKDIYKSYKKNFDFF